MNRVVLLCTALSLVAVAEPKPAAPVAPAAVGPEARKPKDEKKVKKEVADFIASADAANSQGIEAVAALHDFPVFMVTDDAAGLVESKLYARDEFIAMMKPMIESMPKDLKMTHKPTITVLSDALAVVVDEVTSVIGKTRSVTRNSALVVKVDNRWKWKSVVEAGWGGVNPSAMPAPAAPKP